MHIVIVYTCQQCWGKIRWDKTITDYQTAKQQALSDLKYHSTHECHLIPTQRTIAIYHSPNQGGNQHAPLDNSLTDDDAFLQREKEELTDTNPFNWKPWLIGAIVIIVGGLIAYYLVKKNKNEK